MNSNAAMGANKRWQEQAEACGFATEKEMLEHLCKEWKTGALADLFDVSRPTIRNRMKKYDIATKPVGGKNYILPKKFINGVLHRQCSKCKQWHPETGYCRKCRSEYYKKRRLDKAKELDESCSLIPYNAYRFSESAA